jgi:ATP adenylyltransferase
MPRTRVLLSYEELVDFINRRMTMSHIYQPLLIKTLLDAGGTATVRQIATEFAASDESVVVEAEKTIRKMPVPVLKRRGVVLFDSPSGLVTLNAEKLSIEQRWRLRALCEQKLADYLDRRGMAIWDYRLIDDSSVPYSLRYQVLAESDRRCALCGATEKERPLDVDHIVPRSRGGTNEKANLQVLCSRCNRAKGNRDARSFKIRPDEADPACPFCSDEMAERTVEESELCLAVEDAFPVTDGHTLVIPKRHTPDFFSMTEAERRDANDLVRILRERIHSRDTQVGGFNIGVNSGEVAGQTVPHAHIHLIPRRAGDTSDPRGGVRGVIPEKREPR